MRFFRLSRRDIMKKVFISYSHDDKGWFREWLLVVMEDFYNELEE